MKSTIATYFLVGKGPSKNDVGGARGIVFQEIGPGELVSKPAILFRKCWGGYRRTTCFPVRFRPNGRAFDYLQSTISYQKSYDIVLMSLVE